MLERSMKMQQYTHVINATILPHEVTPYSAICERMNLLSQKHPASALGEMIQYHRRSHRGDIVDKNPLVRIKMGRTNAGNVRIQLQRSGTLIATLEINIPQRNVTSVIVVFTKVTDMITS